jgi:2-methylisocitrate lyase-like PEP mutase family enzyme
MISVQEKAERLRALHHAGEPLVLVNAWDAASARIIEELGFPVIATTSAGIAWTEGFADGQHIPRDHMLARVKQIVSAVDVPVTADLEGAYGDTEEDARATALGAIDAGAVGLNFEDAASFEGRLLDAGLQAKRIQAMRNVAQKAGVPLVINVRTDTFLAHIGDSDTWRLEESIRRGNRYLESGADCVFVPGVSDEQTIRTLVAGISGPVNVLASATTPPVLRLKELGVARVSLGSGAIGYALARFREAAKGLRNGGSFDFVGGRISHAELNTLFEKITATSP